MLQPENESTKLFVRLAFFSQGKFLQKPLNIHWNMFVLSFIAGLIIVLSLWWYHRAWRWSETEKQLLLKYVQDQMQGQSNNRALPGQDGDKTGSEKATAEAANQSALYTVRQGPQESPTEFLENLQIALRKHTDLDPASDAGKQLLISLFREQSSPDIRKKLRKLKEPDTRDLKRLVEEAWRVFVIREMVGQRKWMKKELRKNQCSYCYEKEHWKKDCPKWQADTASEVDAPAKTKKKR